MGKGINLGLESLLAKSTSAKKSTRKNSGYFWVHLATLHNKQVALQMAGEKIQRVICSDKEVYNAVATLKQAKEVITTYGASEGLMAVFNNGNQLSEVLHLNIPTVTALNQRSVGQMCCESIDGVVEGAKAKVIEFFDDLSKTVADYLVKLKETTECQKATLTTMVNDLLGNIDNIDASAFGTEEVFGFTAPVFMERLDALNSVLGAMGTMASADDLTAIEPALRVLGYQVEEKTEVVPESPEAAAADAPAPEEVMSAPIAEPPAPGASQEELEAAQEEPAGQREEAVPMVEEPADAPQEQEMAVFRWTPASIKDAATGLIAVLDRADAITKLQEVIAKCRGCVEAEDADDACIDKCRNFAAAAGQIAQIVGKNFSDLFDQIVAMCGKLKKNEVPAEAPVATPVEEVTEEKPLGNRRRSFRMNRRRHKNEFEGGDVTEHEFEPEKQMDDPAGTLPDDTEGPVKEEDVPSAKDLHFNEFEGGDVTEHEFDPEKQMDDPAGTLPDDSEGDNKKAGDEDPAGTLPDDSEGEGKGTSAPTARRYSYRNEGEAVPEEPIVPPTNPEGEPIVEPAVVPPAEPAEVPAQPVAPVNPDGTPIEEQPLVPPQPAMTNEAGVEEPEGIKLPEAEPEGLDDPAPGVDPNGDPQVPKIVTEPHIEPTETPAEDIPEQEAEKLLSDHRFSFF